MSRQGTQLYQVVPVIKINMPYPLGFSVKDIVKKAHAYSKSGWDGIAYEVHKEWNDTESAIKRFETAILHDLKDNEAVNSDVQILQKQLNKFLEVRNQHPSNK